MALPGTNPNKDFEALKQSAAQARLPFERDAWLNMAFYLGEQYTKWDAASNSVQRIPRHAKTPNAPRPVVNKIMHYVQQELAQVLQDRPSPDVVPPTIDLVDVMDSNVAAAYCDHVADPTEANFDRALNRAGLWSVITGMGFMKWVWDPNEKKHCILPCNWFDIFLDPYATDFTKNRYIIHSQFLDPEQVYEAWGVTVKPGAVQKADLARTQLIRGMGSAPVLSGVTVNELWMKPCKKHPRGLYVVWSGTDVLVAPQPLPYNHQRLPFTAIGCIERPDSQYFMSPVTFLRPAQMELNKVHAQEILAREKFANHKWLIPAEAELEEEPNDEPAQILRYSGALSGVKPEIIQGAPPVSSGHAQMIEEQMMHIVGLHEVSQAQVPGRVEAAKAIEMLKDSDDSRQETMRKTIETTVAEGFFQVLENARQFESEEKMILTYGRDRMPEVKHFRAGSLKPGFRVRVTKKSGLARSRAARQDQVQRMWDAKVITDPAVFAELMEVPIGSVLNYEMQDISLARNENLDLAKDTAITPNSWDEHAIHIREHNTYRKTHEYVTLPDEAKKKFDAHVQMHEQMLDAALQKAAQRAQLAAMAQAQPASPAPQSPDSAQGEQ
jgi:hypothetical protein